VNPLAPVIPFLYNNKRQGNRKLGYGQVQDIRTKYEAGATQGSLAREYDISVIQIGRIVRGEVWRDAGQAVVEPATLSKEEMDAMMKRSLAVAKEVAKGNIDMPPTLPIPDVSPSVRDKADLYLNPKRDIRRIPDPLDGDDIDTRAGEVEFTKPAEIELSAEDIEARNKFLGR